VHVLLADALALERRAVRDGIGISVILIFSPRTLMARSTISSTGTELTTCS